ncbi:ribosome silencing factor [Anaerotignum lactatifermentans]|uniref:Ribosomal silencing factor RsfS n=1 Tax=Anaerotignum lactatifermentans TaxID=160404 RepID=A0ABS2G601_9FIRM|nr:ribosome silencing factor [Anaerotignum lactatifermentans]MBM6828290.1 ribosome silencing factor [Anaerotignum lactatifermentans]MBM6876547.1 ribosome silencing factor [Anaerotignum lactatifermentans]MBM6949873.1 ribosome silencing factor [Anaerotignum lactatifermentans]
MEAMEAAKIAQAALDDKMGQDIQVLDLRGLSNVAEFFVIASGNNVNHLRAMADEVEQKLFQAGVKMHHSEGYSGGTWILLDFGSILIHLFNKEEREFYGLEHVWSDAKTI